MYVWWFDTNRFIIIKASATSVAHQVARMLAFIRFTILQNIYHLMCSLFTACKRKRTLLQNIHLPLGGQRAATNRLFDTSVCTHAYVFMYVGIYVADLAVQREFQCHPS